MEMPKHVPPMAALVGRDAVEPQRFRFGPRRLDSVSPYPCEFRCPAGANLNSRVRRRPPTLPAGEPFPIRADVGLHPAFRTNRHHLTRPARHLSLLARFPHAPPPFALRRCRFLPRLPFRFVCHKNPFSSLI